MKIFTNFINKTIDKNKVVEKTAVNSGSFKQNNDISSVATNGISQVNANMPVSYTKIGEIPIPGIKEKASVFKLANGQRVIILPKKGPTCIKTTYNVGSLNEKDEVRGISHFIEHNLFKGSKNLKPGEFDVRTTQMGADTNAATDYNTTSYYLNLQLLNDNSLEEAIKLNADMTQYPTFDKNELDKEKEPVKSEIDMYADKAANITASIIHKNLFGIKSSAGNLVLGTKNNINQMTSEKLQDYFKTWYTPDNAVTVITGDVDVNETMNLVSKYYNKKNDYSKINQRQYEPLNYIDKTVRTDVISKNSNSANIAMGFAVPEGTSQKEKDALDFLISLFNSNKSSLSKKMDKYSSGIEIGMSAIQNKPDSAYCIDFSSNPSENEVEDVLKIIYEEITNIANNPPSQDYFNEIKTQYIRNYEEAAETSSSINDYLTAIMLDGGNFNYFADKINSINSLTPQDISNAARKFLDLNKTAICVSHAKDTTEQNIRNNYNNTQNIQKSVSFGAKSSPVNSIKEITDKVEQYTLSNNIKTTIIPGNNTSRSTMTIDMVNENLNDVSQPALTMLSVLLEKGTAFKNKHTMDDILDQNNISISNVISDEGLSFAANFRPENMQNAMALLKENIMYPNFSQEEFEKGKNILKCTISEQNETAKDNLLKDIYGGLKAQTSSKEELLKELDALTLDDVKALYTRILSNAKVRATFAGPTEQNPQLKNIFNNELSYGLPLFKTYTTNHDSQYNIYKPNTQPKVYTQEIENNLAEVEQTYTYKVTENLEDDVKIDLLSNILGGGMNSRLFTDLRGEQGLAYSVGLHSEAVRDVGMLQFYIGTPTNANNDGSPENINKSITAFNKHVELVKTENVTDEELEKAKNLAKTAILNNIETNIDIKYLIAQGTSTPYGLNYYLEKLKIIDKITPDDIRAAANYVFKNPPITTIDASKDALAKINLN